MNILIPHSWLQDFVQTRAQPKAIKEALSLHSASVERLISKDNDKIYDIEITNNRIDMASVEGIAREVAAVLNYLGTQAIFKPITTHEPNISVSRLPITIQNNRKLCKRVLAIVIDNVDQKPSPLWMQKRLERSGVRSLNNIVDVTNYVMLETGHPTHVFDYDRLTTKKLIVRLSKKGEKLTTFDGKTHTLTGGDIVIDDGTGTIIDLPGIAGTKNSVVTKHTKRILFFIESNDPIRIRKTAMKLGITSYASAINKNLPDPECAKKALLRGIELFNLTAGGTPASVIYDDYNSVYKPKTVSVSQNKVDQYLGRAVNPKDVVSLLKLLGFKAIYSNKTGLYAAQVPSWRQFDIAISEDLIEEIARIIGYYTITNRVTIGTPVLNRNDEKQKWVFRIKHLLCSYGYTELYTSSLVSQLSVQDIGINPEQCIKLKNPLTEDGVLMRPSLVPAMLQSLNENKTRKSDMLMLFELSCIYLPKKHGLPKEPLSLTLGIANFTDEFQAFLTIKGALEALAKHIGIKTLNFASSVNIECPIVQNMHAGLRAEIRIGNQAIGVIGKINEYIIADLDIERFIWNATKKQSYTPIPEHPPILEDMTIKIPQKTYIGPVIQTILNTDQLIKNVALSSEFENNYTFRVTFQDPLRTLTDREVASIKKRIVANVAQKTK